MKPVRCEECKLFFDIDRYETCPHCAASNTQLGEQKAPELWNTPSQFNEDTKTNYVTVGYESTETGHPAGVFDDDYDEEANVVETAEADNEFVFETEAQPEEEQEEEPVSIAQAIKQTESTVNTEDMKTIAFYDLSDDVNAVAGWLVCIKGAYKGESFTVRTGRNNIGRALTNDIALAQEMSVSRERHAAITFDPVSKKYFVQAGESRGLTYLNGELLMEHKEIVSHDKISFGTSEFVFIPLCSDKFSWENYS